MSEDAPAVCVQLRDGARARLREIRETDRAAFAAFHAALSDESLYNRYFGAHRKLGERELARILAPDRALARGLVAEQGGALIGHASWHRIAREPGAAEVAFEVADALHGRGLGTLLLHELARHARAVGIARFVAHVLPHNREMLAVFRDAGYAESARFEDGVVRVDLQIAD